MLALVWTALTVLAGCAASPKQPDDVGEPGAGTVVTESGLPNLDPALGAAASVAKGMTYRSRSGIDDDNTHVTGAVFVPKGEPPPGGFPVVALAPQAVGTTAECAASLSPDLLGGAAAAAALLKAGYVVFVPDYQGLGKSDKAIYHPYLDSTTAGYVIIDGVRATKNFVSVPTSESWAVLGSLEGGQAAWAANELVDNYGSGLNLVAAASLSPMADFEDFADAAMAGTLTPEQKLAYVAYLAAVHGEHQYDVDLDDYRRGAAQQNWDALLSCRSPDRMALAEQIPPGDLKPADDQALERLRGYMQKTTLPQGPTSAPMYVIYGGRDPMISAAWTERALGRACQMGDVIQIANWPDKGHREIDPLAAVGWLRDRLESHPSANDCTSFLASHDVPPAPPRNVGRTSTDTDADTPAARSAPTGADVSLTAGWLPVTVQLVSLVTLALAVGRRSGDWRVRWVPAALMVGFATAAATRLFVKYQGWTERAASWQSVFWTAATGFAIAIAVFGWSRSAWSRRLGSVVAVLLCVLSAGLALNTATGYFPTVNALYRQVTGTHPDDWINEATLSQMVRDRVRPAEGTMVWLDIPNDASGFDHRRELVYLPPAWFGANPPPALPVVMMLGGEFSQPSDWPVSADAVTTLNRFAATHDGNAPVVVFPDTTGSLSNDTECVNGPRGAAADHLVKDVVPLIISRFGVSPDPAHWGLVGWSSGGTCALMTAVMHPEMFGAFVALDGQLGPNTGTRRQTVARLFGGDEAAWAAFDPRTVIEKHGRYDNMAAWLGVSEAIPPEHHRAADAPPPPEAIEDWDTYSEEHAANARKLCLLLSGHHIECSVVGYPGAHDFVSAGRAFESALPWLAGRLGTPGVPERPLPG